MKKSENNIASSGYAIDSLEAALWSFYHTDTFEEALLKAVNLGDDADTVGAITGQIAGAYYGVDSIPIQLLSFLSAYKMIKSIANHLVKVKTR